MAALKLPKLSPPTPEALQNLVENVLGQAFDKAESAIKENVAGVSLSASLPTPFGDMRVTAELKFHPPAAKT